MMMNDNRLMVLEQICKTPGKTCKFISMETDLNVETVRYSLSALQGAKMIRKITTTWPHTYEPDRLRGVSGKQLPEFAERLRAQQVSEYTRCWKPARDMGEFLRSLRA